MRIRPTEVSPEQQAAFDAHMQDLRNRVLERIEPMLAPLENPDLQNEVYEIAFSPNDVLPKRTRRPHVLAAHLTEQVYLAHASDDEQRARLLDATVLLQEYTDIVDDIADSDVATGQQARVVAVAQPLLPLLIRRLDELDAPAVDYWTRTSPRLSEALFLEIRRSPSPEAYAEILDGQSYLFAIGTGLAAMTAGCDTDTVERCERIGKLVYKYAQVALDLEQSQSDRDEDDVWNAERLLGKSTALDRLDTYAAELTELLEPFPEEQAQLISTTVAVDTDQWDE